MIIILKVKNLMQQREQHKITKEVTLGPKNTIKHNFALLKYQW